MIEHLLVVGLAGQAAKDFQGEMLTEDGGVTRRIKTTVRRVLLSPNDGATVDGKCLNQCNDKS